MRGALTKLPGIGEIQLTIGEPNFTVHYDSKLVKPEDMLAALKEAKEPAKLKS